MSLNFRLTIGLVFVLAAPLLAQQKKDCPGQRLTWGRDNLREEIPGNVNFYLGGGVTLVCPGRYTLKGDSVVVFNNDLFFVIGHASFKDSTSNVVADTLTYRKSTETVQARIGVVITQLKDGSTLTSPAVDYLRKGKGIRTDDSIRTFGRSKLKASEAPRSPAATRSSPWEIEANHMVGVGTNRVYTGGDVIVDRDTLHATADSMIYDSSKDRSVQFIGKPAHVTMPGKDSLDLKGSDILMNYRNDTLRLVRTTGHSDVHRGKARIRSKTVLFDFVDGQVTRTRAWDKDSGATVVTLGYDLAGDSIAIDSPKGVLAAVQIFGRGTLVSPLDTARHVPGVPQDGPLGRDAIWGTRIVAKFQEIDSAGTRVNRVTSIDATGKARSLSTTFSDKGGVKCPSISIQDAENIHIVMRTDGAGGVANVMLSGNVSGAQAYQDGRKVAGRDSLTAPACTVRG